MNCLPACLSGVLLSRAWIAAAVLLAAAPAGRADVMSFTSNQGLNNLGAYTGTVGVSNATETSAIITFSLMNTSPVGNGGYITGFAFNNPGSAAGGNITAVTGYSSSHADFVAIGSAALANQIVTNDGIAANPLGMFDLGAAVGGDWLGGGNPSVGIAVGQTSTFSFTLSGSSLLNLTAASITAAFSDDGGSPMSNWLALRFRGFDDGGSDKVTAGPGTLVGSGGGSDSGGNPGTPAPVPAPAGLVLAGLGALCALAARGRRFAGN